MRSDSAVLILILLQVAVAMAAGQHRRYSRCSCQYSSCVGTVKDKSDNSVVYFGLGAALSLSLFMMTAPTTTPAPPVGRSANSDALPRRIERAAAGALQLLDNFRKVVKHPACSERIVCEAERALRGNHDWSAALGLMGSVAAGTVLDDPVMLSDVVLPFLFRRPLANCQTLSPSCDVVVVN